MPGWNIADVLEVVADEVPDSPAVIQGDHLVTWGELDRRADAVAAGMVTAGLTRQAKVAQYLRNGPAYIESLYACLKVSLVPVNTNYRYGPDELTYLWTNADAEAVVFGGEFAARIEPMRHRVPQVELWLWVDDGTSPCPAWAVDYEALASGDPLSCMPWSRDGDDLLLLYTGGTTGLPKGVMWRQDDLFMLLGNAANGRYGSTQDLDYARRRVAPNGRRLMPAAPLMHGAGCFSCVPVMARGGAIVLLESQSFDPVEFLDTVDRFEVDAVMWVGDAFARPVADALDAEPARWSLKSLKAVTSGGVVFSEAVKRRLLARIPQLLINDVFGASEAITVGSSIATRDHVPAANGSFSPRPDLRVINDSGRDVVPGSAEVGQLAFGGRQPLGYYKDEAKTADVFRTIDGHRYSVPGDWATVAEDGTVTLLGRGSACINTGGEKVFPDEVEQALCSIPGVVDAAVVGVPHERFGSAVVAVVQTDPGTGITASDLIARVGHQLAGYKVPRRVVLVDELGRGPTGKVDLNAMRSRALRELGVDTLR
jgi:acyl-CoA synthetase (AMP-forming)/AMP-acid ligase II